MRRLDEPVQVRLRPPGEHSLVARADGPGQFIWRGRLYVVRDVVDHWRERRAWWRDLVDGAREPGGRAVDPLAPESLEHEVWRVEASAGRGAPPGIYDLRHTAGAWSLVRLAD